MDRIVWSRDTADDFGAIVRAVNLAALLLESHEILGVTPVDLDGDPVDDVARVASIIDDAQDAIQRVKYVRPGLETLRVMLLSD